MVRHVSSLICIVLWTLQIIGSLAAVPELEMSNAFLKPGENVTLTCHIISETVPTVTWLYVPCEKLTLDHQGCQHDEKIVLENEVIETVKLSKIRHKSVVTLAPEKSGLVTCTAKNDDGTSKVSAMAIILDLDDAIVVWSPTQLPPVTDEPFTIVCGISPYIFADMNWFKSCGTAIENSTDITVTAYKTPYTLRKVIHWNNIKNEESGSYVCRARILAENSMDARHFDVNVMDPFEPTIKESTIINEIETRLLNEQFQLLCKFDGLPRPEIRWYKNDKEIISDINEARITIENDKTMLSIRNITTDDEGKYRCEGSNRHGRINLETMLKVTSTSISQGVIIGGVTLVLLLIAVTAFYFVRIRRARQLYEELKASGLANFVEGNIYGINPDLALNEQADLLPYDDRFEFPSEKLKLDKQLGSGAFGVVMKGFAQGIRPHEEETVVAVKMVKKMADNETMKALITELKIMCNIGHHLNVVNLLGAVTKNITQRDFMVIVEYCQFGNLQHFLAKHRYHFIDQIQRDTDMIDSTITNRFSDHFRDYITVDGARGMTDTVNNPVYTIYDNDYSPGGTDSGISETLYPDLKGQPTNGYVQWNETAQPTWNSNYRMNYKGPARSVTTTDLICWAFQVARGMEYLSSRKVLHGDLAARNVLLCDDNVVKICDFGLARSLYKTEVYRKQGNALLPIKWLAPESNDQLVFSTFSDVWSFGVFLWELFSLGTAPYPGMNTDQSLFIKIKGGYRMAKPEYATQEIYDIMLSCWRFQPDSRPLFDSLDLSFRGMLETSVSEHYVTLNEPYSRSNVSIAGKHQSSYLAMIATPDYQNV